MDRGAKQPDTLQNKGTKSQECSKLRKVGNELKEQFLRIVALLLFIQVAKCQTLKDRVNQLGKSVGSGLVSFIHSLHSISHRVSKEPHKRLRTPRAKPARDQSLVDLCHEALGPTCRVTCCPAVLLHVVALAVTSWG